MKPTIGRIVIAAIRNFSGHVVQRPALIVQVEDDENIEACVFLSREDFSTQELEKHGEHGMARGFGITQTVVLTLGEAGQLFTWRWPERNS